MINVIASAAVFGPADPAAARRAPLYARLPFDGFEIAGISVPPGAAATLDAKDGVSRLLICLDDALDVEGETDLTLGRLMAVEATARGLRLRNRGRDRVRCLEMLSPTREGTESARSREICVDPDAFLPQPGERYSGDPYRVQILTDRDVGLSLSRAFIAQIKPGDGLGRHVHAFDQFYLIIGGTMSLEVGVRTMTAQAGDFVVLPAGTLHRNWNAGDEPVLEVTLLNPQPVRGLPLSFKATVDFEEGQA